MNRPADTEAAAAARGAPDGGSEWARRLAERRQRYRQRGRLYRAGVVALGTLITLAGVVMTGPIPGPGFLIIPVGLSLLALEFTWAERLLGRALEYAERQKRKAAEATRTQKVLSAVAAVVAVAAFAVAAILWDIPWVPV